MWTPVERWDRWCCLELLTSSSVVRVLLDGAVYIISVIYFSFMALISYWLLHSRKGLSTVVQGIFWKFPCIFNSHFLCIFRYYKCSISEHSLHASQYTLPVCLQGFQNKGFGCMQSKLRTAAISSFGLCQTLIASCKGPNRW